MAGAYAAAVTSRCLSVAVVSHAAQDGLLGWGQRGRVLHLREFGPTPYAFTLREHFPPPGAANFGPTRSPEDWTCPA